MSQPAQSLFRLKQVLRVTMTLPVPTRMEHLVCGCNRPPLLRDREGGQCLARVISGIEELRDEVTWDEVCSANNPVRSLCVGLTAFDALGIGLAACNAAGHLLGCNRTADTILKKEEGLRLNSAGILCTTEGESDQLAEALHLAACCSLSQEQRKDFALTVRRRSGKRPLTLFVRSLAGVGPTEKFATSVVVVLMVDSSAPRNASVSGLSQLYGLTTREAHLANLLAQGLCLEVCCHELGISRSTGSSHLKRMFKKTGVHHQSQLVSLLLKSIAMAGLRDEEQSEAADGNRTLFPQRRESFRASSSRSGG